ncbi:MAG: hypothetical protein HY718_02535 [Planctomycetes bacterium]|nr:hypothetical protein [Planctomycetota bacterium]
MTVTGLGWGAAAATGSEAAATQPSAIVRPASELRLPGVTEPARGWDGYADCNNPLHWDGDTLHVFSSASHPYHSSGPDLEHLARPSRRVAFDNDAGFKGGGRWIEATYKDPSGRLYGWYHNEPPDICGRKYMTAPRIGAAVSQDNGLTWHDLGFVLEAPADSLRCDTVNEYFVGGNGDFSVILDRRGEYFHFVFDTYHADPAEQGVSMARMRYADRDQPAGKVWKWHRGAWDEPGLGGHVTPIFLVRTDWHREDVDAFWGPSIHWNTYLNHYVVLLNHAMDRKWTQEGIYVAFNPDVTNPASWAPPVKIKGRSPFYPQVIGTAKGETDKQAGRVARFFLSAKSRWEIVFLKPGEPPPASQPASAPQRPAG